MLAALWGYEALHGERIWDNLQDAMTFEYGAAVEGKPCGVMSAGPGMTLRAGTYRLDYEIDTDGENTMRLAADNTVSIFPDETVIESGQGSLTFTVYNETDNFQILIDDQQGTYLRVEKISLTGRACMDMPMTVTLVLLSAIVLCVMRLRGRLNAQAASGLLVLAVAVLIASTPCLKENLNVGDDMPFHLERLGNLTNGLRSGQFPVRLGAYMNRGFGAVTSVYYPELFLYLPAGMILLGTSIQYAMQVFLAGINVLTAASMFICARRLLKNDGCGYIASVLYTLATYRLTDLYTRSAIGEALAMAFMPLFVLMLWEVCMGDKRKWPGLALAAAAIYQSHMISTLLIAATALVFGLALLPKLIREKRLGSVMLAVFCCAGLCAFSLVPLITYNRSGVTAGMMVRWNAYNTITPAQLLFSTTSGLNETIHDESLKNRALEIGAPLLLAALAAVFSTMRAPKRGKMEKAMLTCVALGSGFALATTSMFPWERVDVLTRSLTGYIQFPWRLLLMTTFFFSLAGGYGLQKLGEGNDDLKLFAVMGLCMVVSMPLLTLETKKNDYVPYSRVSEQNLAYQDYTLEGTYPNKTNDRTVHVQGEADVGEPHRAGTTFWLDVQARTAATISVPLYAFDGYEAEIDGQKLTLERGEDSRLAIRIPAGTEGRICIRFVGRAIWRAADAVSLLTLLGLLIVIKKERKKHAGCAEKEHC